MKCAFHVLRVARRFLINARSSTRKTSLHAPALLPPSLLSNKNHICVLLDDGHTSTFFPCATQNVSNPRAGVPDTILGAKMRRWTTLDTSPFHVLCRLPVNIDTMMRFGLPSKLHRIPAFSQRIAAGVAETARRFPELAYLTGRAAPTLAAYRARRDHYPLWPVPRFGVLGQYGTLITRLTGFPSRISWYVSAAPSPSVAKPGSFRGFRRASSSGASRRLDLRLRIGSRDPGSDHRPCPRDCRRSGGRHVPRRQAIVGGAGLR